MGHIAEFGNLGAFAAAYVSAHRPDKGVAQVCLSMCVSMHMNRRDVLQSTKA